MSSRTSRFKPALFLSLILLGPLSYLAHEFGHWATGEALGLDMWMTLNKAGAVDGEYGSQLNQILVSLGGPALTLLIGFIAYWVAVRTGSIVAYGVLFFQFMLRLLAGGITLFAGNPNDEAYAGILLGVGPYPLTLAVVATLLALTWSAARHVRPGWAHNFGAYVVSSAIVTVIVFSDRFLRDLDIVLL